MFRKIAVLLLVSLLVCGFSSAILQLTGMDSGKTIKIRLGTVINISLEGNPTTGYIWETASRTAPVLTQVNPPAFKPGSKLIGAGGIITFQFRADKKGNIKLTIVYHRPWEKNKAPIKTFQLNITVID